MCCFVLGFVDLFSAIMTGNVTAWNSWGNRLMQRNDWCCSSPDSTSDSATVTVFLSVLWGHSLLRCNLVSRRIWGRNVACNNFVSNG